MIQRVCVFVSIRQRWKTGGDFFLPVTGGVKLVAVDDAGSSLVWEGARGALGEHNHKRGGISRLVRDSFPSCCAIAVLIS